MSRFYFYNEYDETCSTLDTIKDQIAYDGLEEKEVFKARRMTGEGFYFCTKLFECGESGDGCGKDCKDYKPRNGKNGRCIHSGYCYEASEKVLIKLTRSTLHNK